MSELTGEAEVSADQGVGISKWSINTAKAPPRKGANPFVFSEDGIEKQERT